MANKKGNKKMGKRKLRKLRQTISASIPRDKSGFKRNTVEVISRLNDDQSSLQVHESSTSAIFPSTGDQPSLGPEPTFTLDLDTNNIVVDLVPTETQTIKKLYPETNKTLPADDKELSESEEIEDPLIIEVENQDEHFQAISGRRIVDVNYIFKQLQNKAHHNNLFDCKAGNFILIGEKRVGLSSTFKFECNMCKEVCIINSENDAENINVNIAATTGIISTGIGYSQFEELLAAVDVPVFSQKYHSKLQDEVFEKWEKTAAESMEAAAKIEKDMAIAEGRTKNGFPLVDVYVDGSWCARSYGCNYKASSGAAAIIGRRTGQVLYIGIKNKYCCVCARAANKGTSPGEHKCFKNFEGSSGSMEAEIIAEGFKLSLSMYGLIYQRMIGDGDASTYSKVLQAQPYKDQNVVVEKIECRNHVLRNFSKKLRSLTTETKYNLAHRKTLTKVRMITMRKAIVKCLLYHSTSEKDKETAISILHNDITNTTAHAYGDHKMCQDYYCEQEKLDNGNELKKIQNTSFVFRINTIVSNVASKSRSLIENVNTNLVECFNNVIAKFIAGKRVNFAQRRSYQGRCAAAVVSFNDKSTVSSIQNKFSSEKPNETTRKLEAKRSAKRKRNVEHYTKRSKIMKKTVQHDYGPTSEAPDFTESEMEVAKKDYLKHLQDLTADRIAIERSTVLQRDSGEWLEIRSNLLTASNFGAVCKRKVTIDTAPLVKNILYKKNLAHVASVAHGIDHEQQALQQMQNQENIEIKPCGLFIDKNHQFLGATPDGLVGDDTVVEVKCPISALKTGLKQSIMDNKIQILKFNKKTNETAINTNSNWYYQVQGQLHISERQKCMFGIWVGENEPVHIIEINKDANFWKTKMEPKLLQFYNKCLLPEIVNPRHARGMPIRNIFLNKDIEVKGKENIDPKHSQIINDSQHQKIIQFQDL